MNQGLKDQIKIGDAVKVRLPAGRCEHVVVKSICVVLGLYYGVEIDGNIMFFSENDVDKVDSGFIKNTKCTCGSDSVGHPGHAHYCDIEHNKRLFSFSY